MSVALLAYLFSKVDLGGAREVAANARLLPLLPAFAFLFAVLALSAWRWRTILAEAVPYRAVLDLTFVGFFFNNFLPANFGGDVVRIYALGRKVGSIGQALLSVFWDRYIGLGGMLVLGAAAYFARLDLFAGTPALWLYPMVLGGFAASAAVLAVLLRHETFFQSRLGRWLPPGRIPSARILSTAFLQSLLVSAAGSACIYFLAASLGVPLGFVECVVFVPLGNVAGMLPVSISGLGVREGAMIYLLGLAGIPAEQALWLSLSWFFATLLMSLWGGVVFLRLGLHTRS